MRDNRGSAKVVLIQVVLIDFDVLARMIRQRYVVLGVPLAIGAPIFGEHLVMQVLLRI